MRYLALDYGTKRIGVAVGDDAGFGAYPLTTIHRSRSLTHDLQEILRLAQKEQADAVVVGLPLNADGTHGPSAKNAASFAASLGKRTTLPIHLHDEFLTTAEAEEAMLALDISRKRRRETIDKAAAALILESFLQVAGRRSQVAVAAPSPSEGRGEAESIMFLGSPLPSEGEGAATATCDLRPAT